MTTVVGIVSFVVALLISYQLFPAAPREQLTEQPLSRFVFSVLVTAGAVAITHSVRKRNASPISTAQPPANELARDWSEALEQRGHSSASVLRTLENVYRDGRETLPPRGDVFRAFSLTRLDEVQVVILGQDPYPQPGRADGLSFSVRHGAKVPHSLSRIFHNLASDSSLSFTKPDHGNLDSWARRGVLLLNAALTVERESERSDIDVWRSFTSDALRAVNDQPVPVVFMAWGDDANASLDQVVLSSQHLAIRSTHPRQEVASRYPRFQDTNPFSRANSFLRAAGRSGIDWSL